MKRTALAIAIGAICTGLSGGVLAQEENQNDDDSTNETTQQEEERPQEQQGASETMDVDVEQEPAEIEVEQESPEITVEQSAPDVTIEQPEPEVTIEQPEPNVTVENAEPNVTVEQGGEAEVKIEQADDAQVDVNNDEEGKKEDRKQEEDRQQSDQADQENSLMSHQASDLEGMTVINQEGEEVGDIQHIAKHNDSGELHAIISVGGFWGIGATEIALPLEELNLQDDQLLVDADYGGDEIEDSSDDYQEDQYSEVDSDITLSEARE